MGALRWGKLTCDYDYRWWLWVVVLSACRGACRQCRSVASVLALSTLVRYRARAGKLYVDKWGLESGLKWAR